MRFLGMALGLAIGFGTHANATTLKFEWIGGPITVEIDARFAGVDMVETIPSGTGPSFSFNLPTTDYDGFLFTVEYDSSEPSIIENNKDAIFLGTFRDLGFFVEEGSLSAAIEGSKATVRFVGSNVGGENTIIYDDSGYFEDKNQGDIFFSSSGYWTASVDGELVAASGVGDTLVPVPLPASLGLLTFAVGLICLRTWSKTVA